MFWIITGVIAAVLLLALACEAAYDRGRLRRFACLFGFHHWAYVVDRGRRPAVVEYPDIGVMWVPDRREYCVACKASRREKARGRLPEVLL